jgi:patatin-like phospholipase/acyl hydrolase
MIEVKERKIRLLSLDGGGIKGILSGQILVRIEEMLKDITGEPTTRIGDYFDIIAGTSTGGILACAYLMPDGINRPLYSAEEVINFYLEHGDDIFHKSLKQKIKSGFGFFGAEYDSTGLENTLEKYFGMTELKELIKPCLIPSLDTEKRKCVFFKQHYASFDMSENFYVKDLLRATTSAPTYFKPASIQSLSGETYSLVDGGVFANNPTLCAYTEVNKLFNPNRNLTVRDVKILSLGTGHNDAIYKNEIIRKWGLIKWAKPSIDMMMSSSSKVTDYELGKLFESFNVSNQYLRVNPNIPYELSYMDNGKHENMEKLKEIGDLTFEKNKETLKEFLEI